MSAFASSIDKGARWISRIAGIGAWIVLSVLVIHAARDSGKFGVVDHLLPLLMGAGALALGWIFSAISQRVVRNSRLRASNRAIFVVPGLVALLLASGAIAELVEADGRPMPIVALVLSDSAGAQAFGAGFIISIAIVCLLCVYAIYSFLPSLLGVDIDTTGTIGEDSIVLWSAPSRIALSSIGMQVAVVQVAGLVGALVSITSWASASDSMPLSTSAEGDAARASAAVAVFAAVLPVVTYYWAVTEYLLLGTVESVHAVGRHVREKKRRDEMS
jgi:hypothetical protein